MSVRCKACLLDAARGLVGVGADLPSVCAAADRAMPWWNPSPKGRGRYPNRQFTKPPRWRNILLAEIAPANQGHPMNVNGAASERMARSFEENYSEATRGLATLQVIGIALLAAHGIADDSFKLAFRNFVHGWLQSRGVEEDEFRRAVMALEELLDHGDIPSILWH